MEDNTENKKPLASRFGKIATAIAFSPVKLFNYIVSDMTGQTPITKKTYQKNVNISERTAQRFDTHGHQNAANFYRGSAEYFKSLSEKEDAPSTENTPKGPEL